MRVMRVLVLALLAACASAPRGEASLEGTYRLAQVNGRPLPAPSGNEKNVLLHEGTLALQPGNRYTLSMVAGVSSQPKPATAEVAGVYRVAGDSLLMTPDDSTQSAPVQFRWALQNAALRLRDKDGHEFTFQRQ